MGTLLNAYCTNCTFRQDGFKFGANSEEDTPVLPAIDETGAFVVAPLDPDSDLSFYHEFGMNRGKEGPGWIQSYDIFLSPDHNKCPQCGDYTMRFEAVGHWGEGFGEEERDGDASTS